MTSIADAPIRGILFDLDGTLVHTSPDLAAAVAHALAECALPPIGAERVERFVGKGIDVLIQRCLLHHGMPDSGPAFDQLRERFMHHYAALNGRHSRVYPGVVDGLIRLRAAGLRLGVCTNKSSAFTRPLLEACDLAGYFDLIVAGDTTARKKPAPDMILYAARVWDCTGTELLMIGDSGNDARAARAAGARVWLVPYGYNEGEPVQGIECDGIVGTVVEAAARLLGMQSAD